LLECVVQRNGEWSSPLNRDLNLTEKVSHETRESSSIYKRKSLACEVTADFYFGQRKELCSLPPHPQIWSPFNLLPTGYIEFYLLGRKQAKLRSRHLPLLSAKIKNVCSITCVCVCVCVRVRVRVRVRVAWTQDELYLTLCRKYELTPSIY
jgi:hypothetical protein